MPSPREQNALLFRGTDPYPGGCREGRAIGPAQKARGGVPAESLPSDHPVWALEAHYLSLACVTFICTLSPQRIILGGGVMSQSHLFPRIRQGVQALLNGYIQAPAILRHIDTYILPPCLGRQVG